MSGTETLRTGVAAQFGFAINALHDSRTIVAPNTFVPFVSEAIRDSLPVIRERSIAGNLFARPEDVRPIDTGMASGEMVHSLLNNGYARLLWLAFAGYEFEWPGSTKATGTLTLSEVPTDGDTITIDTQTYTFRDALTASTTADEILNGATAVATASNVEAAINRHVNTLGLGSGDVYGSLTPRNADVEALDNGDGTVTVTDRQARGAGANSIATTASLTEVGDGFGAATLTGGVNGTDTARLHRFTLDGARMFELLATAQIVRPPTTAARAPFTYVGKIISFILSFTTTEPLRFRPTWDTLSRTLEQAIAAPSFPTSARWFDYTEIGLTIDTVTEPIQGATVTVETGQASRAQAGTATRREHLIQTEPTITGELTREFENTNIYEAWIAGEDAALEMTATGVLIPGSASNYGVTATMPVVRYTGATPNVEGTGIVQNNIPFEVLEGAGPAMTLEYLTNEGFAAFDGD